MTNKTDSSLFAPPSKQTVATALPAMIDPSFLLDLPPTPSLATPSAPSPTKLPAGKVTLSPPIQHPIDPDFLFGDLPTTPESNAAPLLSTAIQPLRLEVASAPLQITTTQGYAETSLLPTKQAFFAALQQQEQDDLHATHLEPTSEHIPTFAISPPPQHTISLFPSSEHPTPVHLPPARDSFAHSPAAEFQPPTQDLAPPLSSPASPLSSPASANALRTTVLPEIEVKEGVPQLVRPAKHRYQPKQTLGKGAVGEVELVQDNDIHRLVAIKRLKKSLHSPANLLRFAEEVRTVGSLEHPNIIPIHDVGLDEAGQYFFVMKYVKGETLEDIITKLQQGDPNYHKRYTFEYRVALFMEILKAIEFAHAKGVIHRDLKPANIMVGGYGEVIVMDWGIAKRIRETKIDNPAIRGLLDDLDQAIAKQDNPQEITRERFNQTRNDTLLGTPAYMAPEQALGQNDQVDERSDLYSLCVLFYEFLTLKHYLDDAQTLPDLLRGIITAPVKPASFVQHPYQSPVPPDLTWFLNKGLEKDPNRRFQHASEMREHLQRLNEGDIPVQCPVTFNKRLAFKAVRLVNRYPMLSILATLSGGILLLGGTLFFARLLLPF